MTFLVRGYLKDWMKKAHTRHFGSEVFRVTGVAAASKVACQVVVERITREQPFIDVAREIGVRLERLSFARQQRDPEQFQRRLARLVVALGLKRACRVKMKGKRWSNRECLSIGSIMLNMVHDWTGMIQFVQNRTGIKNRQKLVVATDRALEWLESSGELFVKDASTWQPSSIPHHEWDLEVPKLHAAVNKSQAIGWKINKKLLAVLEECFTKGIPVADLPGGNKPESGGYTDKATWAKLQRKVWEWKHKRRQSALHLAFARSLPDPVYYRWRADFRGRIYPSGRFTYPHGPDLGRALLEFAVGEPIGDGLEYLKHHGANMWGLRLATYPERCAWVDTHKQHILRAAREPLDFRWWEDAKEPWRFLRFCFELDKVEMYGRGAITNLPCQIDGTANGLQIIALLTRDSDLAKSVNLCGGDRPNDLYAEVVKDIKDEIAYQDTWGWKDVPIDRATVKGAALCWAQGGSLWGATEQIKDWFWKQPLDFPLRGKVNAPCTWMARKVLESIQTRVSVFVPLRDWFKASAKSMQGPVKWVSPIGLPIEVKYYRQRQFKIRDQTRGWEDTDKLDLTKIARSVFPNFIQSLDAAALIGVVNRCDYQMVPTHDCFGALAPHMEDLHRQVRTSYAKLFSRDHLRDLAQQLNIDTDGLPDMGAFTPTSVITAPYAFT